MLGTLEKRLTDQDYEALPEGPPYQQLIDGELIMTPASTPFHQNVAGNIYHALRSFAEAQALGHVFISPIDVRLTEYDVYQPDIIFFGKEKLSKISREKLNTVPDLVIEVLSPSNAYYDLTHKKTVYAQGGVREYWIVDPNDETVEIFINEAGRFQSSAFYRGADTIQSPTLLGLSLGIPQGFAF